MYYRTLFKHSFLFGSLVGAILILASLTFYWKGVFSIYNPTLSFINRALIILGIYLGVRKYRDEVLFGVISYGRAFVAGVLMIAVASSFYAFYIYILTRYFDNGILQEAIDLTEKGLVEIGYKEDMVELFMALYRKITPELFAFSQWFNKMLAGVFFSLIVAFFFRKKRNLFNNRPIDKFNGSKNQ